MTNTSTSTTQTAAARLVDVSKVYRRESAPVRALSDVSLAIAPHELVALVGPSGCGKSTLLNLLAGVDRPDSGGVWVGELELARAGERELVRLRRERIGIVFQAFHLVPHLTCAENVALPLELSGRKDPGRVHALLERVGLASRAAHYPAELSGGEQQRTAVARALVHRPALLIADEPTGNLDSASGTALLALLDELRREHGMALVIATHDPRVSERADRTLGMRDGRIVAQT
jgi:putative ABC transport system ATP-binding protein